jgi:hypothetical protein
VLDYIELGNISTAEYNTLVTAVKDTLERCWLRHYATSRKVAGSIPDEVTGFFN